MDISRSWNEKYLEINGLTKSFGKQKVLDGVDLSVRRGQITVILGRSGCGKSVLLKHILGLVKPDAGSIWFDGNDITDIESDELDNVRRRIGMVFQGGALFDSMSVSDNIAFGMRHLSDWIPEAVEARVEELLRMVDLFEIKDKMPSELSGGMKKRVALLRAIAPEPDLVLFDEPTTGLDPVMVSTIDSMTRKMVRAFGATALVVTHDLGSAFRIADRMAFHHMGKILCTGTPEEFRNTNVNELRKFLAGEA